MATVIGESGRRMAIGRVLSRAFAAIGAAPAMFFGISLVLVALPSVATQLLIGGLAVTGVPAQNPFLQLVPMLLSSAVIWWLLYMAAQAMLFRATVAEIDGRPDTFGGHAGSAASVLLPLVALAILTTVGVWIGLGLLIVPGIMLAMMWSVAAPALVIERTGVFGAFGRSRYLTRGSRWSILGLVVLVFAIYFAASLALGLGSVAATGLGTIAPATPSILGSLVSLVLQTAFVTIWSAVQAALYVDLRDAKDGPAGDRLAEIFA